MVEAHPDLEKELKSLSPDEAAMFLLLVEQALKKRRVQLAGYVLVLFCMVGGMLFSLYVYGNREPGEFVGWVFLIPFLLSGAVLLIFGRWSKSL